MTHERGARRGKRNWHAGAAAESRIAQDYTRRGFSVTRRRWRSPAGEVDLILRDGDGDGLVFVEVKKSRSIAAAAERITARQMARICSAAECFLAETGASMDTDIRFDVALMDATGTYEILENAFGEV